MASAFDLTPEYFSLYQPTELGSLVWSICFYIRDARIVPVCGKGRIAPTASAAKEVLEVDQLKIVADSGYYKGKDIAPL